MYVGIMLLEKQLLVNMSAGLQPTPPKRARKATKALPEDTVVWVELSKYVELHPVANDSVLTVQRSGSRVRGQIRGRSCVPK